MPRFIGRPVVVEAIQFMGGTVEPSFALSVRRHLANGAVEILTDEGPRACKYRDWIVRGPDGTFAVITDAKFEAMFSPHQPAPVADAPAKRAYNRKVLQDVEEI